MLAIDTETTGLALHHGCKPFFISACDDRGELTSWEWEVDPYSREPIISRKDLREVKAFLLEHLPGGYVFHNAKFDIRALSKIGISWSREAWEATQDTVAGSHVLASGESHKLKDLALHYLDISDEDQADLREAVIQARRLAKKKGWDIARDNHPHWPHIKSGKGKELWGFDYWLPRQVAIDEGYPSDHPWHSLCSTYALLDAERTIGLWLIVKEALEEEDLQAQYEVKRKLIPIAYRMEAAGVTVNRKRLKQETKRFKEEAIRTEDLCYSLASHKLDNIRSFKQLQGILYAHFSLPPIKKTKTGLATDDDTLEALQQSLSSRQPAFQFIKNLRLTRKLSKANDYLETYRQAAMEMGPPGFISLHPDFNVTGTATTRFSSSNPNAQNISKQEAYNLRRMFGPVPGRIWYAIDYENIELRIFAYECGDQSLIDAFESGESVHLIIAQKLWPKELEKLGPEAFKKTEKYRWTKNGNFSLIYGASQRRADATYHQKGAYKLIRKGFPLIDRFMRAKNQEARELGYVTTLGGYRLQVSSREPHKAVNYFVQGSAGWALSLAMLRVGDYLESLGPEYQIILQIHDELVYSFPKKRRGNIPKIRNIKRLMEQSGDDLGLPLPVSVDEVKTNWADGIALAL